MDNIVFSNAKLTDLSTINQILYRSKAYWGYDQQLLERFIIDMGLTDAHILSSEYMTKVCYKDKRAIAFFTFHYRSSQLELLLFFIDPLYIGQGVGQKMWKEATQIALTHFQVSEFLFYAEPNALKFYIKQGCTTCGKDKKLHIVMIWR